MPALPRELLKMVTPLFCFSQEEVLVSSLFQTGPGDLGSGFIGPREEEA